MTPEFLDTNVLVYSLDRSDPTKHARARALVAELLEAGTVVVSTQVLLELFTVLTRKAPIRLPAEAALAIVERMLPWPIHSPTAADVVAAARLATEERISLWDANIVQSALAVGARTLWSEDLQHQRRFEGLVVRNPFWPGVSEGEEPAAGSPTPATARRRRGSPR